MPMSYPLCRNCGSNQFSMSMLKNGKMRITCIYCNKIHGRITGTDRFDYQ